MTDLLPHRLVSLGLSSLIFLGSACGATKEDEDPDHRDDGSGSAGSTEESGSGGRTNSGGTDGGNGDPSSAGGSLTSAGGAGTNDPGSGGLGSGGMAAVSGCENPEPLLLSSRLSCGGSAEVLLDHGPHQNRVNYAILGDGYTSEQLDSLFLDHVRNVLDHEQGIFGGFGEPYVRYRNFINLCAIKVPSNDGCVDDLDSGVECDSAFDGYGDDLSRLGIVSESKVHAAIGEHVPKEIDVDWVGITINAGASNWWASGGSVMVWNGGYEVEGYAASVALHEGGHTFHGLADEYKSGATNCGSAPEINVSLDNTGSKWSSWLGFDHTPGTGLHGSYEGARYCDFGIYRPTVNSEMNQLPDHFNMPSIEKMVLDIYDIVEPIDAHTENAEPLHDPPALLVQVVDPEVILVDWSVDGELVAEDGGSCFDPAELGPGAHTVTARAYDPTPWVRAERSSLEQSVSFDVVIGP